MDDSDDPLSQPADDRASTPDTLPVTLPVTLPDMPTVMKPRYMARVEGHSSRKKRARQAGNKEEVRDNDVSRVMVLGKLVKIVIGFMSIQLISRDLRQPHCRHAWQS